MAQMTKEEEAAADLRRAKRDERRRISAQPSLTAPRALVTTGAPATDDEGEVDVLSVLGSADYWVAYRGVRQKAFMRGHDILHGWTLNRELESVSEDIRKRNPKVVLNEVWALDLRVMAALADRYPSVQFVALSHGAPGWVSTVLPHHHYGYLRLARERANCYYGTVMETHRLAAPHGTNVVSLPNFSFLPDDLPAREDGPPTVSLIARDSHPKQWGLSAAAVAIAARQVKDLHVVSISPDLHAGIEPHISWLLEQGIPVVRPPWGAWQDYLRIISSKVDAHITATLSESFCVVPLEHCLMGRPVAGTFAVEWLPDKWKGNPQDPQSLADILVRTIGNKKAGAEARKAAKMVVDWNHKALVKTMKQLIGK